MSDEGRPTFASNSEGGNSESRDSDSGNSENRDSESRDRDRRENPTLGLSPRQRFQAATFRAPLPKGPRGTKNTTGSKSLPR